MNLCRNPLSGQVSVPESKALGASSYDVEFLRARNAWLVSHGQPKIDEYIIDKNAIYRLNRDTYQDETISNWPPPTCPNFRI